MITLDQALAFTGVVVVLIAIPGPSVVFTIGRALAYGRAVGLMTVVGNSLGLLGVLTLVAAGLGQLVATSVLAFEVLKYGGALYLIWLGLQAIRTRHGIEVTEGDGEAGARISTATAVRQGFVIGFTNPKAYVIFAAVLPQFVDRSRDGETTQMLLLGLIAFAVGMVSDSIWALSAGQLRRWFNASPARGRAMTTAGGVSMVGLGVALALTGRPQR